jgi:Heavy-metal resistance
MFGFFFGTACVAALAFIGARGRRYRHGHFHGHFRGHRGRGFRRWGLRRMFDRLDTAPGQEKTILNAIDDLTEQARNAIEDQAETGKRVAGALREEHLDERTFAAIFDEPLSRLGTLRDDFAKAVSTVHETLTPAQRGRLADLVESGVTRWGCGFGTRQAC